LKKSSAYQSSRPATLVSHIRRIGDSTAAQAGGARRSVQLGAPFAHGALPPDPGDLVTRALAILSEDNITTREAQSVGLPRQPRVANGAIQTAGLPLQRRILSDGTEVPLPVRYFDAQCLLATFVTELSAATALLEGTGLQATLQEDGKAIALLGCFEYRTTDIGPYNEVCLAVSAVAPGDPIPALYVTNLPVTTAAANQAGREIWGFNKFVTSIEIERERNDFSTMVRDPGDATILMLEGRRSASVQMAPADVLTFSVLAGKVLKTVVRVMTSFKVSGGENFVLNAGTSAHPMANNLRTLALDGARPVLLQYADPFQSLLFPGRAV
jgi:hypothetical protein